ncbi:thioredoxin [Aliihoeflea sp. PC F10.4]
MHRRSAHPVFAASFEGGSDLIGGGAAQPADLIKDTTTATFAADVVQESRNQPVLVDFWAPWCGPCKQLQPALEKVVAAAKGRVKLVKMNIDEHPSIAGQLGIQSIPAVIAFKDGQPVDGFMGAVPESKITEFIDKVAGPGGAAAGIEDALNAAAEARQAGDLQGAVQIYSAVLAEEAGHPQASAALAAMLLDAGQEDDARSVIDQVPADKAGHPEIAAVKARLELGAQVAGLCDPQALAARLEADPADHEARFDLALIQNAQGDRTAATDSLLAIVKADREWREDGARAQLLKFFEAWGMTDPATLAARRKLSSLLFS